MEYLQNLGPFGALLAGVVLLFFGRQLFWFFVGVVGFLFGLQLGGLLLPGGDQMTVLALSILLGLVCAVLAIFLQKILVVLAGAAAAGLLAMRYATEMGLAEPLPILAFLLAAIVGAILIAFVFEWALIILSAWTGASLIATALPLQSGVQALVTIGLLLVGVLVQARIRSPESAPVRT